MTDGEKYFLNAFNAIPGVGAATLRALRNYFGSYEAAWRADTSHYAAAQIDAQAHTALRERKKSLDPDRELRAVERAGTWMVTDEDAAYPPLLKEIHSPPVLLYGRGAQEALTPRYGIAVVGTRRPTPYGIEAAETIVSGLTRAGVTIISGCATGIDAKAHKATLEHGGVTVAVLGSGADRASFFPQENYAMAERIVSSSGAVISEYAPGTPAVKEHFPMRNRIIAGLAHGTLVVEARERSGALITARLALEENRDVYAVPGSIFSAASAGPNRLIRDGAKVVARPEDLWEELGIDATPQDAAGRETGPLTEEERTLLALLENQIGIDDIKTKTGLAVPIIMATLSLLELKKLVRGLGADTFQKI